MARDKVTIREVANAAGVSIATVSYVINNRTDVKISNETRKKVLQVINLLDYTPNAAAKALAANQSNKKSQLAFYNASLLTSLNSAESFLIFQCLSNYFHKKGFEILLLNNETYDKCDQADTIICYNINRDDFMKLGDNNFIPLIALDCMINDPIFFQINAAPETLVENARKQFGRKKYISLMLDTENKEKKHFYTSSLPNMHFTSDIKEILSFEDQNILVYEKVLYDLLKEKNNVCYVPSLSEEKLEKLQQCIDTAIKKAHKENYNVLM